MTTGRINQVATLWETDTTRIPWSWKDRRQRKHWIHSKFYCAHIRTSWKGVLECGKSRPIHSLVSRKRGVQNQGTAQFAIHNLGPPSRESLAARSTKSPHRVERLSSKHCCFQLLSFNNYAERSWRDNPD